MLKSNESTLILIDGSSFLYRAFHALPPLENSRGEQTGAIFGVANMLKKLLNEYSTPHFVVVFDAPGKTFRDDLYPDYKANRPPMAVELRQQVKPLYQLLAAMGLPTVVESGVEADDVIGTLAIQGVAAGLSVIISTGDKDMAQLVNEQIILENTLSNTRMDVEGVIDKFGVRPEQMIDYLALMGDAVDNIPGVPKVGPKTAAKWLKQYGCLNQVMASAEQIKGKVGENLRASLDQLPLSRQLATIKCDVELPITVNELKRRPQDRAVLRELLKQFEFSAWLRQLDHSNEDSTHAALASVAPPETKADTEYELILTQTRLDAWLSRLKAADYFAFDTETTSLDYISAHIVGISFAVEAGKAAYVPLAHDYIGVPQQLNREQVLQQLKPLLEDSHYVKLGQNLKYDAHVLANYGIQLRGMHYDTMLESYVLDSTGSRHDMDSLAEKYLGRTTIHFEDVAGKGVKQITFNQVSLEEAGPYAAEDAEVTLCLHQHLFPRLVEMPGLLALFEQVEMPLISVLCRMERNGVLLDCEMLIRQSQALTQRMDEVEQQAFKLAGQSFNLASPKQIQAILFEEQGLPVIKKTPKGQPSTAESVLQELALEYPLPEVILEYRGLNKLISTYTDRLPEQVNAQTGRVHTSYHQAVTATGRLSSSDPNLQNIPIRKPEGRRIRQAFITPPEYTLVAADYSQIELRIMAHLSDDPGLLDAFSKGADVHRATAAEVFSESLDTVTEDQRRSAKAINFGLIYGMSAFGLAKQLGVDRKQAQAYIDVYFTRYPGVKLYMDKMREQAREQGYVETLYGRRLYLPEINARNAQRRQYAERTAINAPMQGTAADIIKRAMIQVDSWIQTSAPDVKMIMQVHDELVFEIPNQKVTDSVEIIRALMSQASDLKVPLLVDIGSGRNWDEAH